MPIRNITKNTVLASQVRMADMPWSRAKGLLGQASLPAGHALVIKPCQSVHMVFMRFAIDVIFVDKTKRVIGLCLGLKPFQFSPVFWKSACAIELAAGTIEQSGTAAGDQLAF